MRTPGEGSWVAGTGRSAGALALCLASSVVGGCGGPPPGRSTGLITEGVYRHTVAGRSLFVTPNPYNALSTVVTYDARGLDSARVAYWADGEPRRATPFFSARGAGRIVTLGLRPETRYSHVVEGARGGQITVSDTVQALTDTLPRYLRGVHMRVTGGPSRGYVLTSVADSGRTGFVVAFDSVGQLRWYREFPGELAAGETKQVSNGDFIAYLGRTPGWMALPGLYTQFRPTGEVVRTIMAPPPTYTDNHEMLLTFRDTVLDAAHYFSYDIRPTDLSRWGLPRDALVAGHQLVRMAADGTIRIVLDGWEHFGWEDRIEPPRDTLLDFDHPNSLDFDHDGNYVVSYRNMGEVTKIDAKTGAIIWRLGGRNNQYTFRNDPKGGFSAQHTARILDNGNLLLYDNGTRHTPPETRVVEYRLDTARMTADLVWEFRHDPPFYVPFTGSSQRLANGNTVIGYSNRGIVTEVSPRGEVVWEGTVMLNPSRSGDFYRAIKIASLYRYERP
jgi:hypothetical protein